jgi:preprotein translocase subunit SecA
LATRDVKEKQTFFNALGLGVGHNFSRKEEGPKECYQDRKVVFGTPYSFQVDILLDEYRERGTRAGRPYQILIVDEVDSMMVDQKAHQTLIASVFPGFNELVYPMKVIWNKINSNPLFRDKGHLQIAIQSGSDVFKGPLDVAMREVIRDVRETFQNEVIPAWRMEFIELSLEDWINSAVTAAFLYQPDKHYIVK